jgi:hypothetical protein
MDWAHSPKHRGLRFEKFFNTPCFMCSVLQTTVCIFLVHKTFLISYYEDIEEELLEV